MDVNIYPDLEEFRQKTLGWHKTYDARQKLLQIKPYLTPEEGAQLSIAHNDLRLGNSKPFYELMPKLISKYRQGPISGPAEKTLL